MSTAFFSGFLLSFSLILAIGSQNAFVLRQGLKEEHVFWVCLTCAISDATLIGIGVSGFSLVLNQSPILLDIIRYAGAAFLFVYGFMHLRIIELTVGGFIAAQEVLTGECAVCE